MTDRYHRWLKQDTGRFRFGAGKKMLAGAPEEMERLRCELLGRLSGLRARMWASPDPPAEIADSANQRQIFERLNALLRRKLAPKA